ncbi:MAG: signal peptidase II [bacterium]|nr:signal peptidase II [bacterium]
MKSKYWFLLLIPGIVFLDQFTKNLILQGLPLGDSIPVIPHIFDIVHVRNRGGAFGIFAGLPETTRQIFFYLVSAVALLAIGAYYVMLKEKSRLIYIFLVMIIAGALGNLWDRFLRGEVVDFLSFHWYDKVASWNFFGFPVRFRLEWPAFNVADISISIAATGIFLMTLKESFQSSCDRSSSQ